MDIKPNLKKPRHIPVNKKEILKADVDRAMRNTRSNKEASRYLGVDIKTYKKYASLYKDEEGNNLYEKHNNRAAVGIPKYSLRSNNSAQLIEIMEGRAPKTFLSGKTFKLRLIAEGFLKEECCRCQYHERRVLDEKVPLILHYIDGNKRNWKLENVEFLCYNCYFQCVGNIFEQRQLDAMEDFNTKGAKDIDFDLPSQHEEAIKKTINLENRDIYMGDDSEKDDGYGDDLIATFKR